jgi:hypothetical protein
LHDGDFDELDEYEDDLAGIDDLTGMGLGLETHRATLKLGSLAKSRMNVAISDAIAKR